MLDNSLDATASDTAPLVVLTSQAPRESLSAMSAGDEKLEEFTSGATQGSVLPNNDITELDVQLAKDASAEPLASKADAPKEDILPAITMFENPVVDVTRTASVPTDDIVEKYPQPVTDTILEASMSTGAEPRALPLQATTDVSAEDNSATSDEVAKAEETLSDVTKSPPLPINNVAPPQPQLAMDASANATMSDIVEPKVVPTAPDLPTAGIPATTSEATALEEAISDEAQTSTFSIDNDIAQTHFQPVKDSSVEPGTSNIAGFEVLTPQAKLESSEDPSVITSAATGLDETVSELTSTSPPYDPTELHPQPVMDTADSLKSAGANDDSPAVHVLATEEVWLAVREQSSCNVFIADRVARDRG
jgi:hypothetical protein